MSLSGHSANELTWKIALAAVPIGIAALVVSSYLPDSLNIPFVEGRLPYIGNALPLVKGSPWDTMTEWSKKYGRIFRMRLFGSDAIVIRYLYQNLYF